MVNPKSKMIEKLRNDELVVSIKMNITDIVVAEIAGMAGFDCIWLDMEHCPADQREVQTAMLAAKARGAETMVRTARGAYSNMTRLLEMDATAIMVPHVMSVEDAKQVAYYTKFHPIGRRPIDGGNADCMYCMTGTEDYIRYSNEEKLTIIQIEDIEAYEQLEEIAQVPGIDMLFFGPADFAHSIGCATNMGDPRVQKAREDVARVARKYGKLAGTVGGPGNLKALYDLGYRFVNVGADVVGVVNYFQDIMGKVDQIRNAL